MAVYYDPHIRFEVRAQEVAPEAGEASAVPVFLSQVLELAWKFDLPSGYSVSQLEDLLDALAARLEVWVDANGPEGA